MTHAATATKCRISDSRNLIKVLSLGEQAFTGVFPKPGEHVGGGPLDLMLCPESGLVQLGHTYPAHVMYCDTYGYRSGLNASMARHLMGKAHWLEKLVDLRPGGVVLDIGSNDGTLLKGYHTRNLIRVGIDPTIAKFREHYPADVETVAEFFCAAEFRKVCPHRKAKVVTSIAMFYDLEDPVDFARNVASVLHEDGVWHIEMSYLPSMLRAGAYDTICHEHIEYYSFLAIERILNEAGLEAVDVSFNHVNGGSFAVTAAHKGAKYKRNLPVLRWMCKTVVRGRSGIGLVLSAPCKRRRGC